MGMGTPTVPSSPVRDGRWTVVERVAASTVFRRSSRSRELLLFICQRALLDRTADLREYHIGCGVFGRKPNYNPGDDNIVRVEMRLLRKRLEEYFASEGKEEPYVIVVPKGTYVPVFEPQNKVSEKTALPLVLPRDPWAVRRARVRKWLRVAQPAIILALVIACVWLWQGRNKVAQGGAVAARFAQRGPLWPLLFNDSQQTTVVCADSTLVIVEGLLGHSVSLEEYLSRDYLKRASKNATQVPWLISGVGAWNFTDIADTRLVQRISRLNWQYWNNAMVRSARTAQLEDFKNGNIVLLGSVRSSPWVHLFDPVLNFQVEYDGETHRTLVRNRSPRPGEQAVYYQTKWEGSGEAYCALALVPNLRSTGNVLIIAGTTGESTEATGEFITNPATSAGLFAALMKQSPGRIPYFEALLKLGTLDGVAGNPEVVTIHILPGFAGATAGQRSGR